MFLNSQCCCRNCLLPVCNRTATIITNPTPTPLVLPAAFLVNAGPTAPIAINNIIPLTTTILNNSLEILLNNDGSASLSAGIYEVSYSANATASEAGTVSLSVNFSGNVINSSMSSATVTAAGQTYSLSKSVIIKNTNITDTLYLVNSGTANTIYDNISLTITKIG